ncbi:MAG: hypothetical protein CSA81_10345 [Acidobacteria bacterium]|nr:MAG: hypothetical protein CSA81_10345 [Acidobacteriota bacterium]
MKLNMKRKDETSIGLFIKNNMSYKVRFYKDRLKFSSAHFTLFPDGGCEKLHGHNYRVSVELSFAVLNRGLSCPFHKLKPIVESVIKPLDEMVLMPANSEWVSFEYQGTQAIVNIHSPKVEKQYQLPKDELFILRGDNVSSEQLAKYVFEELQTVLARHNMDINVHSVCVLESTGQEVCFDAD